MSGCRWGSSISTTSSPTSIRHSHPPSLQQLRSHEQRTHGIGRRDRHHGVAGGAIEQLDRVVVQAAKLHPFDGAEIGQELISLADGRDAYRLAVQANPER